MKDKEPHECGFIECDDGSILWGSTWDARCSDTGEPICAIYHREKCGAWIPFTAVTRSVKRAKCDRCQRWQDYRGKSVRCTGCGDDMQPVISINEYDCDWIESEETLYYHDCGGDGLSVSAFTEPDCVPGRIWIADGVGVRGPSVRVGDDWVQGDVLTDAALLAMGYRRVYGPAPDPFAGGVEGDTFYDERTGERVPDERGRMCGCCNELFVENEDDFLVVNEYEATDDEIAGLYCRNVRMSAVWACPLPRGIDDDAEHICPKCSARALADYGLHDLLIAWQADPSAMPVEQREALLDAVRDRVDDWVSGCPENRTSKVHEWFATTLASRLDISDDDARRLCEDAGYGGTHG